MGITRSTNNWICIIRQEMFEIIPVIFRRNETHCISPYAIVVCVCVCVSVCVCLSVYMPRLWTSEKRFEIETFYLIAQNNTGHNL